MQQISRLEDMSSLDRVVTPVQRLARMVRPQRVRDALHGVWLGHPLHPVLVQAPVGAYLSAAVLDVVPGSLRHGGARQSRRLVAFGLLASSPAALAGAVDWSEQHEQQMRVGVLHLAANLTATALYGTSLLAGGARAARALRFAGLTMVGVGGLLGGHISFRQAGGANHAEAVPHLVEPEWHDLMPADAIPASGLTRTMLGEVPVVVLPDGDGGVHVLADRCSHLSGPLSDGDLSDGCLTCPWHGSTFRIHDGAVVHGPATAPQPVFRTRIQGATVQACLPGAG
jgi:nitrite reductase/ring-hydroxylating ferredoxin subunit